MIEQINKLGEMWWDWMWPMFWQVGVLIALIGVVDLVIRKHVWPQVRYALWLLVLVRLVLPPTFSLPTSVTSQLQPLARHVLMGQRGGIPSFLNIEGDLTRVAGSANASTEPVGGLKQTEKLLGSADKAAAGDTVTSAGAAQLSWQVYVMLAWLLGALVLAAWLAVRLQQLRRPHRGQADAAGLPPSFGKLLADAAKKLNLRRLPKVIFSDTVASPAVFGILKPTLLLPRESVTGFSQKEAEHVLLHELAHIKRRDLWVNGIFIVLQIVYWFNPLLWLVRRQLRHLRELCCDATVARILREKTADYRQSILETARRLLDNPVEPVMGILGLFEDSNRLLIRLKWLEKKTWKYHRLRGATVFALIVFMSACVLPMAKAQDSEKTDTPATKNVIADPETGLQFRKVASLTGERDIVTAARQLRLSPNGKFLLLHMQVIPLKDGKPFNLVDFPAYRGTWSPDGKKIAFYSGGIWVIPMSPHTARPLGPAKKLVEGEYWYQHRITWSPDSERFAYISPGPARHLWTYSLQDGSNVQMIDEQVSWASWSPDGNWIACQQYDGYVWLIPAAGGTSRKLVEGKRDFLRCWSPDSSWILGQTVGRKLTFVRVTDALSVQTTIPEEIGDLFSWHPDGEKLLFYKKSADWVGHLKIVPASGGPLLDPFKKYKRSTNVQQHWTADSRFVATHDWQRYWIVPVAGGEPFPLELNVQVEGKPYPESISLDRKKLLFSTETNGMKEYWVVPVSIEEGKATGDPLKVFDKPCARLRWATDSNKIAVVCEDNIWIARADGSAPLQLTETPEPGSEIPWDSEIAWDPDGKTITWLYYSLSTNRSILYACELPQGEPKRLIEVSGRLNYKRSDDGTKIAFAVGNGDKIVLSVIAVSQGEPKKLTEVAPKHYANFGYAFSPDGQEVAIVQDDRLSAFSLPDGTRREIVDFNDPTCGIYPVISWSPDGQTLVLHFTQKPETGDERSRILTVSARGGKWNELAVDDHGDKYSLNWSPNGNWIAYTSIAEVKTADEAVIWELQIDSFLKDAAEKTESNSSSAKD